MELWASKFWVAYVALLIVIKGEGEGSVVVVVIQVEVTERKDIGGHQ